MKGIYTIEIENIKTKEKRIIKKENAIYPMYKRFYEIESPPPALIHSTDAGLPHERYLMVMDESECPTTNESNEIILTGDFISWYGVSSMGYPAAPIFSNCQKYTALNGPTRELSGNQKHIYFHTDYIEGAFTIPAISIYWYWRYKRGDNYDFEVTEQQLFSTTDIEPMIQVESNERVKFYYEIIQEWE